MQNTTVFYNNEDAWSIAKEVYGDDTITMEPYYVNMCLPNSDQLEYLLIRPFTSYQKDNMVAWLAVRNDGEHYGEAVVLTFPKQSLIYGSLQIENRISNDSVISQNLSLWNQQGSTVIRGDIVVVPINESVLYVEPIYLTASTENSLPEIVRIIVAYHDKIVMANTLEEALAEIFGTDIVYPSNVTPEDPSTNNSSGDATVVIDGDSISYTALVQQIKDAMENAKSSSQTGDWSAYGNYFKDLENKIDQLDNYNATLKPQSTTDNTDSSADNNAATEDNTTSADNE